MNLVLWIVQGVLALAFLVAGMMRLVMPRDKLAAQQAWVNDFSPGAVKVIGALEVLGAIGLIAPGVTGILPWLTLLAAAGLALTMTGAILTHIRRREYPIIGVNGALMALAIFVVVGRLINGVLA